MAVLAAGLYALNTPVSKLLLLSVPSVMMAAFLYLGAGLGILGVKTIKKSSNEEPLQKKDLPYVIGMVLLDIAAPICMMTGLKTASAANAALLNNFEIAATAVIALVIFKEKISKKLWAAIILVTIACMMLSIQDAGSLQFSSGSLFVLAACVCWGLENNCTRMISERDPLEIVIIKGLCSGTGSLIIALSVGEKLPDLTSIVLVLLLGFVSYGLSIYYYISAQRYLGAARTSTYYAVAPFIGAILSLVIFQQIPSSTFLIASVIMAIGTWLASDE